MSNVQALRKQQAAERTPERKALAAAIERQRAEDDRRARANRALAEIEGKIWAAQRRVDETEKALSAAKAHAAQHVAATYLGKAGDAPQTPRDARTAAEDAQDELDALRSARTALENESGTGNAMTELALKQCVWDVVKHAPATERMLRAFATKRLQLEQLRQAITVITFDGILHEHLPLAAMNDLGPLAFADTWRVAIEALHVDADAPLPEV